MNFTGSGGAVVVFCKDGAEQVGVRQDFRIVRHSRTPGHVIADMRCLPLRCMQASALRVAAEAEGFTLVIVQVGPETAPLAPAASASAEAE